MPSFAITVLSLRHPRMRFLCMSNATRIGSSSRLGIFGASQHMERHLEKSQTTASM